MHTRNQNPEAPKLGEIVAAAYELGSTLTPDRATATDLAARHLERVLVRGGNARLVAALADLGRELAAQGPRARRPRVQTRSWTTTQLAAAR